MRTTARRLRSELRLFRDLLEGDQAERLSVELQWLGHLLGAVRDLDVMGQRLRTSAGELVEDLGPLFHALTGRHDDALAELREALQGERYRNLLEHLSDAAEHALLRDEAWGPCGSTLPPLAHDLWRRLRSSGRALDLSGPDEDYHEVRKRAKRARYGAESVAPMLAPDAADAARRFAKRANAVQDVLGEHQDATLACQEIRRLAAERLNDGPFNLAAGRLLDRQEGAASVSRTKFFKIWHRLDQKKYRRWMKA
jgi:CHAD domain-containing protein